MRSVSLEKMEFRVNPVFFWHGIGYFEVHQKNKLNKINRLRDIFYLNFGGLPPNPAQGRTNVRSPSALVDAAVLLLEAGFPIKLFGPDGSIEDCR